MESETGKQEVEKRTNYWKEVRKELPGLTRELPNVLLLIHNSAEFEQMVDFINFLPDSSMVLYVSLTKTYESLKPFFGLSKQELFIVDCVSQLLLIKEPGPHCLYARPPGSLPEIIDLVSAACKSVKPHFIIIDSLSQFIDFSSFSDLPSSVFDFYEQLKVLDNKLYTKSILLYDENRFMSLKNVPVYYFDMIMRMEVKEQKTLWQD